MVTPFVQQVFFVSGQDKLAKRDARTHLMRELLRKKRWAQDRHPGNDTEFVPMREATTNVHTPWENAREKEDVFVLTTRDSSSPESDQQSDTTKESNRESRVTVPFIPIEDLLSESSASWRSLFSVSSASSASSRSSPDRHSSTSPQENIFCSDPVDWLQSNSDPFDAYPCNPTTRGLSRLLFNAINFKTMCLEIWDMKENASYNPLRDLIYPVSSQDPAAFGAFLAMTAAVRNRYTRIEVAPEALDSKLYSIRLVNERIAKGSLESLSDGTLTAVFGLAVVEAQYGDRRACAAHSKGLQQMLNQRGGLNNLHEYLQLFFGVCSMLSYPNPFTISSMFTSKDPKYSQGERGDINMELRTEELIEFSRDVEKNLRAPLSVLGKRAQTYKARMFLHRTIARSAKKRFGQSESLRYQDQCRFASLAYVHLMILEYRDSPSTLQNQLDSLVEQLRGHKVQLGVSADILVWMMNQAPQKLRIRDYPRTWRTNRFMSVIKLLTDRALIEFIDYLFDALEGKTSRKDALHNFWTEDDIWKPRGRHIHDY